MGGTASAAFACAYVISTMVLLANGGALGGASIFTDAQFLGILAGELLMVLLWATSAHSSLINAG